MSKPGRGRPATIRPHDDVLGYLIKHAHQLLEVRTDTALRSFGVTVRDLGAMRVIAGGEASSQQDVARVLGVDRTSMVALLDDLEDKGLIGRRPAEHDRRRNLVELTDTGRELFVRAEAVAVDTERSVTAALGPGGAAKLRQSLRVLLDAGAEPQAPG